jgi:hypothetical protein
VTSIKYIADWTADTELTYAASSYTLAGNYVVTRSVWPTFRGLQGLKIRFKCGIYDLADSPSESQITAARASVKIADLRLILLNYIGHYFSNREGQGAEIKYEVSVSRLGPIPSGIKQLLQEHVSYRMV